MKAESNTMPQRAFQVDKRGDFADISFFDQIKETEVDGEKIWKYNHYILTIPHRADLELIIPENFDAWLESAKATEYEIEKPKTIEEKVEKHEVEIATLSETLEAIFGGI